MTARVLAVAIGCVLLATNSWGQMIIAWDDYSPLLPPGVYDQMAADSPAYPGGAPIGPPFPGVGGLPPAMYPLGATAIDNMSGIIYSTDGITMEALNYPFYPAIAPAPGIYAYTGPIGPVHGMDIDPVGVLAPVPGPILWVTDGFIGAGVAPGPGNPIRFPPFPIVGPIPVQAPPLTGLDWDPWSQSLWAVDTAGFIYHFLPALPQAIFLGPGPAPPGMVPPQASGIAIDKAQVTPLGPIPPLAFYVSFPGLVIEYLTGAGIPPGAAGFPSGLSFHGLPARMFGAASCNPLGIGPPMLTANSAAWSGNPFFALNLTGIIPGSPVVLAIDTPASTALPWGNPLAGGILFVDPFFSPAFGMIPFGPMPAGGLFLPAPLFIGGVPVPPGFTVYAQFIALECAGASPSLTISDALQIIVMQP